MENHYFMHSEYGVGKWIDAYAAASEDDARAVARDNHEGRRVNLSYLGAFKTHKDFMAVYGDEARAYL